MYFSIATIIAILSSSISLNQASYIPYQENNGMESSDFVLIAPPPQQNTPSRREKKLSKSDCKQMDQQLNDISNAITILQMHNNSTKNIDYDSEEVQDMYKLFVPLIDGNDDTIRSKNVDIPIIISAHESYSSIPSSNQNSNDHSKEEVILEGIKDIKTNQQFERIERLIKEEKSKPEKTCDNCQNGISSRKRSQKKGGKKDDEKKDGGKKDGKKKDGGKSPKKSMTAAPTATSHETLAKTASLSITAANTNQTLVY